MKIHLDLDAFFISAERIKHPELRGIPAAVGGRGDPFIFDTHSQYKLDTLDESSGAFVPSIFYNAQSNFLDYFVENGKIRGIIITASYEARKHGIKTGMTIKEALLLYPNLKVVPPNHLYYHQLSHELKHFLQEQIPLVEQYSIDEFFADVHGWVSYEELPNFLQDLQAKILEKFSLPISIGAARSKWTAKLATSYAKPQGIKIVENVEEFIHNIPIEEFPGIGRRYLRRLRNYGIKTLGETKDIKDIFYSWKKPGIMLYNRIWGVDNEPIIPTSPRKSIGISRTIDPVSSRAEIERRIAILARHLAFSIAKLRLNPSYYAISIKYDTGHKSKAHYTTNRPFSEALLKKIAIALFRKCDHYPTASIIRIGISCARFEEKKIYNIFTYAKDMKLHALLEATKAIRLRFGTDAILWGCY
ncbi:DNA polymerase IV [Nitratiruptor sp. YY09-18]|uniref:DNA polymerase Y family protein n=1 Tax=Nitratiruptor sp. YY09-18 TaxID=2724901 RepID=UPI001915275C|nr:DNA polymerase IV [Nitratiruptor sp. YY09-18]BCD67413.1 DNA polymerase IV [Nitratiruptor sp. YY09-18]